MRMNAGTRRKGENTRLHDFVFDLFGKRANPPSASARPVKMPPY